MEIDYARAPFWYLFFLRKKAKEFNEQGDGSVDLKTDKLEAVLKPFSAKKVALFRFLPLILVFLLLDVVINFKTASLAFYSIGMGVLIFWYSYFSDIENGMFYTQKWFIYLATAGSGWIIYALFAFTSHLPIFNPQTLTMALVYIFAKTLCFSALCVVVYEIIEFKNQRWWILEQQVFRKSPKFNYRSFNLTLFSAAILDIFYMVYLAYK